MDGGRHEHAVYSSPRPFPSRWGGGQNFAYFEADTDMSEVLLFTHSVTLLHSGVERHPRIEWPERTTLLWMLVKGNSPKAWHPLEESLGLYLILRSTSISGLLLCTCWYQTANRAAAREILNQRAAIYSVQLARANLGCSCMACSLEWLANGWVCPWARF